MFVAFGFIVFHKMAGSGVSSIDLWVHGNERMFFFYGKILYFDNIYNMKHEKHLWYLQPWKTDINHCHLHHRDRINIFG